MPEPDTLAERLAQLDALALPERPRATKLAIHGCDFETLMRFAASALRADWKIEVDEGGDGTARWVMATNGRMEVTVFLGINENVPSLPPTFTQIVERRLAEMKFMEVPA